MEIQTTTENFINTICHTDVTTNMHPEVIEIKLKKADFDGSNFLSNEDCALARGIKRALNTDATIKSLDGFVNVGGTFVMFSPGYSYRNWGESITYDIVNYHAIFDIYHKELKPKFPYTITLKISK